MASASDIRDAADALLAARIAFTTAEAAFTAAEAAAIASCSTEQAAVVAASETFQAAVLTAREDQAWVDSNAAYLAASAARDAADLAFQTAVTSYDGQ